MLTLHSNQTRAIERRGRCRLRYNSPFNYSRMTPVVPRGELERVGVFRRGRCVYLKWTGANSAIPCRTLALEQFDPKLLRFQPLLSATMVLDRYAEAQQLQRVSSLIASVFAKETEPCFSPFHESNYNQIM